MVKSAVHVAMLTMLACASIAQADTIPAAQLLQPQGKVLVNAGGGFAAAQDKLRLMAGDTVFVGIESGAIVSYPACAVELAPGSLYRVTETAPCQGQQTHAAAGAVVISPAFSGPNFDTKLSGIVATGGVLLVTAVVVAIAMSYDSPEKAISPP